RREPVSLDDKNIRQGKSLTLRSRVRAPQLSQVIALRAERLRQQRAPALPLRAARRALWTGRAGARGSSAYASPAARAHGSALPARPIAPATPLPAGPCLAAHHR